MRPISEQDLVPAALMVTMLPSGQVALSVQFEGEETWADIGLSQQQAQGLHRWLANAYIGNTQFEIRQVSSEGQKGL